MESTKIRLLKREYEAMRREVNLLRNELQWAQTVGMDYRQQALTYRELLQKK